MLENDRSALALHRRIKMSVISELIRSESDEKDYANAQLPAKVRFHRAGIRIVNQNIILCPSF
mgnify:CR=1 FL=1